MTDVAVLHDEDERPVATHSQRSHTFKSPIRWFWILTVSALFIQAACLFIYSAYLFHRFDLTDDFAIYDQAWWLISHGHLNPIETITIPTHPYWQQHFELAMWPLAQLGRVWDSSLQLLWFQDIAIVATELITIVWVYDICRDKLTGWLRLLVPAIALLALLGNVWWYETASFDVHFETLGLPLVVLTAYNLWRGRFRASLISAAVALTFGDVVTISIICVGLAALTSGHVRRQRNLWKALTIMVLGVAWFGLATVLNANQGAGLVENYGYLIHARPSASTISVMKALLLHPSHAFERLGERLPGIGRVVAASGLVGIFSSWGFFIAAGTLIPAALNANSMFISPLIAFQTLVTVPLIFVGSLMVILFIGTNKFSVKGAHGRERTWVRAVSASLAWAIGVGVLCLSLVQNVTVASQIRQDWWRVDPAAASVLRTVEPSIPTGAEVVSSNGVIGRIAGRVWLFPDVASPQAFPVEARSVVFVFAISQGIESVSPGNAISAAEYVKSQLHGVTLVHGSGIWVLEWHPPRGIHTVVLP